MLKGKPSGQSDFPLRDSGRSNEEIFVKHFPLPTCLLREGELLYKILRIQTWAKWSHGNFISMHGMWLFFEYSACLVSNFLFLGESFSLINLCSSMFFLPLCSELGVLITPSWLIYSKYFWFRAALCTVIALEGRWHPFSSTLWRTCCLKGWVLLGRVAEEWGGQEILPSLSPSLPAGQGNTLQSFSRTNKPSTMRFLWVWQLADHRNKTFNPSRSGTSPRISSTGPLVAMRSTLSGRQILTSYLNWVLRETFMMKKKLQLAFSSLKKRDWERKSFFGIKRNPMYK